jgi:hypothetical protein
MKQWFKSVCAVVAVLVFAAAAYAGMTSVSGEVAKYEAGKTISVKEAKGTVAMFEIAKDTKVEGDVKVGAKVSVEAEGNKAHSVKASK